MDYSSDCKSVDAGSIPTQASILLTNKINKIQLPLAVLASCAFLQYECYSHSASRADSFPPITLL